eukprot:gene24196-13223_t
MATSAAQRVFDIAELKNLICIKHHGLMSPTAKITNDAIETLRKGGYRANPARIYFQLNIRFGCVIIFSDFAVEKRFAGTAMLSAISLTCIFGRNKCAMLVNWVIPKGYIYITTALGASAAFGWSSLAPPLPPLLARHATMLQHATRATANQGLIRAMTAAISTPSTLYLPLGDSITWGCGTDAAPRGSAACARDAGGYRAPLAWALSQHGMNVTTMGTLTTGPEYVPSDWTHHEGHPGWRFDQIDAILDKSLATSPDRAPDLVTIHLGTVTGTNDCGQGLNVSVIEANANKLLAHLYAKAPNAAVFMASMIGFPAKAACSAAFNALVPGIVAQHKAAGMKLVYVPMAETSGVCVDKAKDTPLFPAS